MRRLLLICSVYGAISSRTMADEYDELIAYRDQLKQQIENTDSEITRCEKTLKAWKTATIIGSVGAVANGIGIIVQNKQIKENEQTLHQLSTKTKESEDVTQFIQKVTK